MKKTALLIFVFALVIAHENKLTAQWQQVLNNSLTYSSLAATSTNIFASSNNVITSSDNGTNWISSGLGGGEFSLSANSSNIFAAAVFDFSYFYISTNNGMAWSTFPLSAADGLMCSAVSGNNIYAGCVHYGIRYSSNNGTNWSSLNLGGSINCIDAAGSEIFAYSENFDIYRSANNGLNWSATNFPDVYVNKIKISGGNVYACTNNGFYRSTNNGTDWLSSTLAGRKLWCMAVQGNNIFAGTDSNGVFLSTDNGSTWVQKNEGFSSLKARSLLIYGDYILCGIGSSGIWRRPLSELIGIINISTEIPGSYSLLQNYPNPFNPATNIEFSVPVTGLVNISIYDALGKEIETLVNSELNPGIYKAEWNAVNFPGGVYFYRLNAGEFTETKKMVLIK